MIQRPIYIFNGLLDSGKTSVIKETLYDPRFNESEDRNMIIILEDGEESYDERFLHDTNSFLIKLDSLDELTLKKMQDLDKLDFDRIILECNGLENEAKFLMEHGLINDWEIAQILTVVDASTFRRDIINLRQFMYDHFKISEVAIFNRFKNEGDYLFIRNNLKAMNPHIELIFEDEAHEIVEFADNEIFDLSQDPLIIEDYDYGLWYMDAANDPQKYENKHLSINVKFLEDLPQYEKALIMGRRAMVCCAEDIAPIGLTCVGIDKKLITKDSYYRLSGVIHCIDDEEGYKTCLLYVDKIEKGDEPKEELVTFN